MKDTENTLQQLLDKSFESFDLVQGSLVKANVLQIGKKWVTLDIGFKSDGLVPIEEFENHANEVHVAEGDEVEVILDALDDGFGEIRLSREKARKQETWDSLEKSHAEGTYVEGKVVNKVKGGFTVFVDVVKAFLPGSLVDPKGGKDYPDLSGQTLEFKVMKFDKKRTNIVLSRKAVLQEQNSEERERLLEVIKEGETIEGTIKNLTDYGAFVDLGGLDGLLHITDLSWKRVMHPKEVLNVGDKMEFLVLSFDQEKMRVSLGLKQLAGDPWKDIESKYHVGQIVEGEVALTTDYGCFVKLDEDIEGLVHITDLDWKNKNINPSSILSRGDSITVKVMEIDLEERKVSLSKKHTTENPWKDFEDKHNAGDILENMNIKSVTDFGIFVELDGGIDGLIHHSEIVVGPEEIQEKYKAGDQITVSISGMDSERERISLSLVS
ncbi:MAG: S1 RNA-binding domain-containing protein [SAR86 cluster bacterium]|uniref:Small ribosomal subunit protein bS1 n=1 Tax=SAR86 cluster bacterium TaxID=2030880 RepID=A0A368BLS6_9GAMM|nr:MAG: S1 RNA-binding domain-containing protein [SAR86 cluster bacterium]|tara:strand:+ start:25278 stop:26591 length:1314 start_codon:yes stop_codon:yes gene_type:complete